MSLEQLIIRQNLKLQLKVSYILRPGVIARLAFKNSYQLNIA